jgi:hypothetical protein
LQAWQVFLLIKRRRLVSQLFWAILINQNDDKADSENTSREAMHAGVEFSFLFLLILIRKKIDAWWDRLLMIAMTRIEAIKAPINLQHRSRFKSNTLKWVTS